MMTEIVAAGHARVIGERAEPLRISGPQMVEIVRDELVMDLPPVTIPIAEVPVLSTIKQVLWWTTLIPGILAVLAIGFAFFARPERRDLQIFATSMMFGLALSIGVFGIAIPLWGLPALSDTTWMSVISQLAKRTLILVIPVMVIFIGLGLASLITTGNLSAADAANGLRQFLRAVTCQNATGTAEQQRRTTVTISQKRSVRSVGRRSPQTLRRNASHRVRNASPRSAIAHRDQAVTTRRD
jgi:hypothetical protein